MITELKNKTSGALRFALLLAAAAFLWFTPVRSVDAQSTPQGTGIGAFARFRRQVATPPAPPTGYVDYFTDDGTGHYFAIDSAGTTTDLQSGGGGGISLPNGQIGYGNGSTIVSDPNLAFNHAINALTVPNICGLSSPDGLALYDTLGSSSDLGDDWNTKINLNSGGIAITPAHGVEYDYYPDGSYQFPATSAAACSGCMRFDSGTTKLQYSNDGSTWNDFGSGGATGNFTFSGNVADLTLAGSGVMSIGSTNTTAVKVPGVITAPASTDLTLASYNNGTYGKIIVSNDIGSGFSSLYFGPKTDANYIFAGIGQLFIRTSTVNLVLGSSGYFGTQGDLLTSLGDASDRWTKVWSAQYNTAIGAQITAATSITPTTGKQHLTGATPITTIAATNFGDGAAFTALADSAITYSTGGNIAHAGTIVSGNSERFEWDATAALWYPQ